MSLADSALVAAAGEGDVRPLEDQHRLEAMARESFQFIWRSLRRLGVRASAADDAAQKVFEIATRRLPTIRVGAERAFLFNTAVRVAIEFRRKEASRRETADDAVDEIADPALLPDETAEWKRRRQVLDDVFESMPMELRAVFVLFELEGMGTLDIAALLQIPRGTVASRLRRAREHFQEHVKRLRAARDFGKGRKP